MRQIIAMGGGGFSMEPDNLLLDRYVLAQANNTNPKICFIPTASGDSDQYVDNYYKAFRTLDCIPTHLSLFRPNFVDLEQFVLEQDILYVGGGNTRNMLVLWKEWGLDHLLRCAYERGIILAGLSAGSLCWFEEGQSDSEYRGMYKLACLGFIKGSHNPHYDSEVERRSAYHRFIADGTLQPGYGVDDGAALHYIDESLYQTVSSRPHAKAYAVSNSNGLIIENELPTTYLGNI